MKVAMMTYSLRPRGGVVHALNLAEALHSRGIDVRLISLTRSDDSQRDARFFRDTSVPFEVFQFEWSDDVRERLRSMIEAIMNLIQTDLDIYHAQDCVCDTALQLMVSEDILEPPIVRTVHHVEGFTDPYLNQCEMNALMGETEKITVSKYWQERLRAAYSLDSTVIYNGIDAGRYHDAGLKREDFLLFVGGMEARKGLEFAIETLEVLHRRGHELRLIAVARPGFKGVESKAWFEHLAERCSVIEHTEFIGLVSDDELIDLYSRAAAFILPTRMEGWGLSIMEAMAAGCPVISSPVGGVTELITYGENGLLVDVGDIHGLADAVESVRNDRELRQRITSSAKELVGRYSWDASAEKTIALYKRVMSNRNEPSRDQSLGKLI